MPKYKLSEVAKEDLIRIHHFGAKQFGRYKPTNTKIPSFNILNALLKILFLLNRQTLLNWVIGVVFVAQTVYFIK